MAKYFYFAIFNGKKKQEQKLKILFFGDIVGKAGRHAVRDFIAEKPADIDFVIANVENASHGFGLTEKNYQELSEYGIDCMTSGNHIWDKKEIFNYIDGDETVLERDTLARLADEGQLMSYKHSGFWQCMDTKREKDILEKIWADGNAPWRKWEGI